MGNLRARRLRPGTAGFSLIEAMVAAGILGVALIGLVRLHSTSMQGTVRAQRVGRAAEVARQLAETVASQTWAQLPPCGGPAVPLPPAPAGCRATIGPSTVFSGVRPNGCTYFADGAAVQDVALPDAAVAPPNQRFRVDMAVSQHPDALNYPNSAVLTVWVCWTEKQGVIREITTSRIVNQ